MADWEDALDQCDTIRDLIDDEVPDSAWDKSPTFFEGINDKVLGFCEWITHNKRVTPKMADALNNMERGVRKWIRD